MPDEWLNADIKQGINDSDVEARRKRFGFNELSSEKENLFIKFLMFFTGPILYGEFSPASYTNPTLPYRVLRLQWLLAACWVSFFSKLHHSSRAQKAWLAYCSKMRPSQTAS